MFENSIEKKEFYNEFAKDNLLDEVASFQCFADGIFTYEFHREGVMHEFNIIADDIMMYEEYIKDLLEFKNIKYFNHNVYLPEDGFNRIASKMYSASEFLEA